MIHSVLLAAALQASTGAPAAPPVGPAAAQAAPAPRPVAVLIATVGRRGDQRALAGLLFDVWGRRGDASPRRQSEASSNWSTCINDVGNGLDVGCIQRLLPGRNDGVPVVAMFALRGTNRPFATIVHCVGSGGAGSVPSLNSLAGLDGGGRGGRARNNMRSSLARCINQAAPGSVTGAIW